MDLLIKNGTVIDSGKEPKSADILVSNGLIAEIGQNLNVSNECKIIDAEGKIVMPGMIDAHCHLREPGFEHKEDIETGSVSAVYGGFTTIVCMPNTSPVIDNKIVLKYVLTRAKEVNLAKVLPIASVTKGQEGKELVDMGLLAENGAVGFSDDGKPVERADIMRRAMETAAMYRCPVISHCEDPYLAAGGTMNEGLVSLQMGVKGIPAAAEDLQVGRELILAEYTDTPIHIAHVSTKGAVELIRQAKKRNVKVTAETCPHYFSITEEKCLNYNTLGRVNPPLRTQEDVEAIIGGLSDGTIDIIATDHAPHHEDEKRVEFTKAPNGMVGFETALSLAYTFLVKPGHLTLPEVVGKLCANPAKLFSLDTGKIEVGLPGDLIIFDTEMERTIDRKALHSKSKNSPFDGMILNGVVDTTIIEGRVVLEKQKLVQSLI